MSTVTEQDASRARLRRVHYPSSASPCLISVAGGCRAGASRWPWVRTRSRARDGWRRKRIDGKTTRSFAIAFRPYLPKPLLSRISCGIGLLGNAPTGLP